MANKQRMRIASDKHSKNINARGIVPKTLVNLSICYLNFNIHTDTDTALLMLA